MATGNANKGSPMVDVLGEALRRYTRAERSLQSAARAYSRRFHEFSDDMIDETTLAVAEESLKRTAVELVDAGRATDETIRRLQATGGER